jgi:hypothetical protein
VHLRCHPNILKRLLVHVAAFNLGVVMRRIFGKGTPRGLQAYRVDLLLAFLRLRELAAGSEVVSKAFVIFSNAYLAA